MTDMKAPQDKRGKYDHLGPDSPHQAKARESVADLRTKPDADPKTDGDTPAVNGR
jgi:hypothetical protein